ncbi:TPA: hypothetical protein JAW29_002925 [Citrobacter freundii]|uniref:hypothetical protein n=1 Tax=Citrobacter freundii TaxID=546 RepID=UPI0015846B39|nr:hypothetical protein [Citrobacter freundii]NUN39537.1 hypothetical protein [Citrobacter freundii]HAT7555678.1 hypothetical protein [Citrobacter freundii]HCB1461778.1 hypothetical protein [Citrobacter freundii]
MAKSFDDLRLNFIYLHELWWLTESIKRRCEELFRETPLPEQGYYFKIEYHIHSLINDILSDAANLKKLITIPTQKTRGESPRQFQVHVERSKFLQAKIKGIEFTELKSVKVRNTLQHFDEYLDEANIEASEGKLKSHQMAVYNFVMSHWEAVNPRPYPIRLYICAEKTYYNMKASVNIGKIYSEAARINEVIRSEINRDSNSDPGGFMIPLNV